MLVACEPIMRGESVRVHYGGSYNREWNVAEPGKLRSTDIPDLDKVMLFIERRGVSFDEVRRLCLPEDEKGLLTKPRMPAEKPPTRVDLKGPHPPIA